MLLAETLRDQTPTLKLMTNYGGGNFKKQFARADKWGAGIALVLGEDEVANNLVVVKNLRTGEQQTVAQADTRLFVKEKDCVEIYENEHDQLEAVKRFFTENGKSLIVGVVLGIGALVGWRYWNNHQDDGAKRLLLLTKPQPQQLNPMLHKRLKAVEKFVAENKNTYGAFASLNFSSKIALINLRLARIQIQQKQPDAALKTLEGIKGEGWLAQVSDLRGDALVGKGDKEGAKECLDNRRTK
ncbi:unnamed protein product [Ranitomeya imitator]|uniref:Histidine--tRNA ligase n=1 Tax=Ranitomeya imitator TaxID=111125 RepID=A0ABN9LPJ1_9NEOB|nr:unnamed protein product [Ranitomeya imitator]